MPNFMDIYYHLCVAEGFAGSGGFSAHDFWSYAPLGRPHLYPPLFHFLILGFLKLGLPPLFIARFLDLVNFPLFLAVIWIFMRQLFNRRLAFFSVLISSSLYSFYLASSNFLPATFAFIFGLLSLLALKKDKIISASICLSLCFYAHAQIPWFFILTCILYGLLDRADLTRCLKTASLGVLFSLPMLIYLLANLKAYHPGFAHENFILELNLYILLAALGLKKVFKERGVYYLLLSLAISVFAFAFTYPYRYISGQGLLGWIFLSAVGLEQLYESVPSGLKQKNAQGMFSVALIVLFLLVSPALIFKGGKKVKLSIFDSTYINLVSLQKNAERPNDYSLSSSRFIDELVKIIRKDSQSQDIIFTNLDFAGTMLSSLAQRADARGMLREVMLGVKSDPILESRLIVWFKDYRSEPDKNLSAAVARYNLEKIAETDIAYIYRNNYARAKEQISRANIPNLVILAIFLVTGAVLAWDISRKRKNY